MGRVLSAVKRHARTCVQIGFSVFTNGYVQGFAEGRIYTGGAKAICVPGLSCYSCPGALGACPLGSLQAVAASPAFSISFYVIGLLTVFGALMGRFVCGWLCPFGLVQDLIYKIPLGRRIKKRKNLPGHRTLRWLKYVILLLFVIVLPMFFINEYGQGMPWFCKYICPSGTLLAGIPLTVAQEGFARAVGWLFAWKAAILAALLVLSLFVYRPFCQYICPLGAIYSFFNPFSLYRYRIDRDKCTSCGACQHACKLNIAAYKTPNSLECIRCGDCKRACPFGAISTTLTPKKKAQGKTRA